jgi:hypothetical protein
MHEDTETVTERLERLRAALEDVRRSVAETNQASQRLLEELLGSDLESGRFARIGVRVAAEHSGT